PARPPKSEPFSRRRYALLCLALATLERSDRQTVLGALADGIMDLAANDPQLAAAGLNFHLDSRDQRRDLVAAVRFLLHLGVLVRLDGDERLFVDRRGDVLYDIRRSVLASLLDIRRAPSTIAETELERRLLLLTEEPLPDSSESRMRRIRTRLYRQLLDDPVLYFDDLDEETSTYLRSQRATILRRIQDATGLRAEIRREGIALVDERGKFSDIGLPEEGTDGHLTLLLAEFLAEHLRAAGSDRAEDALDQFVGLAALEKKTADLIHTHRRRWAKRVREPGAPAVMLGQTLERLEALRLIRRVDGGVLPLAAICRYALEQENTS
ncbi:MAG: TIGR02678 family protein, partial [Acidobacteriota bacterium]